MGNQLVTDGDSLGDRDKDSIPLTYTQIFYQQLPYFLSIGMTWDDYWNSDCLMTRYYREADRLKRRRLNEELWLQGMYVYEAIGDMAPVLRFSMDKRTHKPNPYPKEPYAIDGKEIAERKEREEKERAERIRKKMIEFSLQFNTTRKGGEIK